MNKQELRSQVRARKRIMTGEEIREKSEKLTQLLLDTAVYRSARSIYGYLP